MFDTRGPALPFFIDTFRLLAAEGIGPGRGTASLLEVTQLDENKHPAARLWEESSGMIPRPLSPLKLVLDSPCQPVHRLIVRFVTPTELKDRDEVAAEPDFRILLARARDRVANLRELYGEGGRDVDFKGLGERAAAVRMTRRQITWVDIRRRSSRTGQTHPLGGFIGEAEYEGHLAEFLPWLQAAQWTGVGRQTVWGKGQIEIVTSS